MANRKESIKGVVVKKVEKPDFKCKDIEENTNEYYSQAILETAAFISKYYVCSLGEALSIYTPFYKVNEIAENEPVDSGIVLSKEQQESFEFIQEHDTSLLFAATGSGKTEI